MVFLPIKLIASKLVWLIDSDRDAMEFMNRDATKGHIYVTLYDSWLKARDIKAYAIQTNNRKLSSSESEESDILDGDNFNPNGRKGT